MAGWGALPVGAVIVAALVPQLALFWAAEDAVQPPRESVPVAT